MQKTPDADRFHIAFIGRTNVGKSTLINAVLQQQVSLVSKIHGTTTDPVYKAMELIPVGPVLFIDTAGIDDKSSLGKKRIEMTNDVIKKADLVVIVADNRADNFDAEKTYIDQLKKLDTQFVIAVNVFDNKKQGIDFFKFAEKVIYINANDKADIQKFKEFLIAIIGEPKEKKLLLGLVKKGDTVLLVMPQDSEAPKGRLILPQAQTIREALDSDCFVLCTKTQGINKLLDKLKVLPSLIITDSKEFKGVYNIVGDSIPLTSFSIIFSKAKGNINEFITGAKAISSLKQDDKILVMEACSHHIINDDIARVRLPKMLENFLGYPLDIDFFAGSGFPKSISEYKLVIHCGACMINRKNMLTKISMFKEQNIPMTNFGTAMAYMNGILDKVVY